MSAQAHVGAWQIGEWVVNPKDDTLTRDTAAVKIEPRMMRLLMCLAETPGEVVSQERLHTEGQHSASYRGKHVLSTMRRCEQFRHCLLSPRESQSNVTAN